MIITSTEMKNNFGKYLRIAAREDIIITKNGKKVCRLSSYSNKNNEYTGIIIRENTAAYNYDGKQVSYEEFLEISANSEERYEYIDGEIYLLASPNTRHQKILMDMAYLFYDFFKDKKCTPMIAPYDIRLQRSNQNKNVVQPDLMVICDLENKLDDDDYYMGVPVLVIEIVSKSTKRKDYVRKMDLYMSTGVSEYWIVNPENKEVQIYSFKNNNININRTFRFEEKIQSFYFSDFSLTLEV